MQRWLVMWVIVVTAIAIAELYLIIRTDQNVETLDQRVEVLEAKNFDTLIEDERNRDANRIPSPDEG
jgi:hypothetical protein